MGLLGEGGAGRTWSIGCGRVNSSASAFLSGFGEGAEVGHGWGACKTRGGRERSDLLQGYNPGMPCDCELDLERRWVRARAWGVVTLADAMENRKKFMSLPGFEPDFWQLY